MKTWKAEACRMLSLLWVAGCLFASTACDSDDTDPDDSDDSSDEESGGARFALAVSVTDGDNGISYLVGAPSLDASTTVRADRGIELEESSSIVGIPGQKSVWVVSWTSPRVTRWDYTGGQFQERTTVSFSNLGLTDAYQVVNGAFVSAELAAFANNDTGEVVFWNPSKMEIVDTLELEIDAPSEDAPAFINRVVARADGTLIVNYTFIDADGVFVDDVAGIVLVDSKRREVVARDQWSGCNQTYTSLMKDGTVYFAPGAQFTQYQVVFEKGEPNVGASCLLRVLPGATEFDRDFKPVDRLEQLSGRRYTGTVTPLGDHTHALFAAWHEELFELTPENFEEQAWVAPGWTWWDWDIEADTAKEVPNVDAFGGFPGTLTVGGRLYFSDSTDVVGDETKMLELTRDGVEPALKVFGTIDTIVPLD